MKVKELIELLSNEDLQAEVALALQPAYPRQHKLAGVVSDATIAGQVGVALSGRF